MAAARLACRATARPHRPAANGRVAVVVRTSARAHIIASDLRTGVKHGGRADASGSLTVHFTAGAASAGSRTVVRVHATLNGRSTSCQAAFRLARRPGGRPALDAARRGAELSADRHRAETAGIVLPAQRRGDVL